MLRGVVCVLGINFWRRTTRRMGSEVYTLLCMYLVMLPTLGQTSKSLLVKFIGAASNEAPNAAESNFTFGDIHCPTSAVQGKKEATGFFFVIF